MPVRDQTSTLHQLGVLNYTLKNLEPAAIYFEKALRLDEQVRHQEGLARARFNLGQIAYDRGNLKEAEEQWRSSLEIFEFLGMRECETVRARLVRFANPI